MVGEDIVSPDGSQGEVAIEIYIETTAGHKTKTIIPVKEIGSKAMTTRENFNERREKATAIGQLGSCGDVIEGSVVDPIRDPVFSAAPMSTGVDGHAQPAVEVVSHASTDAPRIRFQSTGYREDPERKDAIHVGAWVNKGVATI